MFTSPSAPLPDTPLIISARQPATNFLSLSTYRSWSKRFAAGLLAAGLQPGDRLLLYSVNNIFFPVVVMGVVMAGGIFTGVNPGAVARELATQLGDSGARWVLAGREGLGVALEAVEKVGEGGRERVFVFDDLFSGSEKGEGGIKHWASLLATEQEGDAFAWEELSTREQVDRPAMLNYSSGTTGMPKGVLISHRNVVANAAQWIYMQKLDPDEEEKVKKANWLGFLPMYHTMAQSLYVTMAPKLGIPVYISAKFDFIQMLEDIQRFKVDMLILVPPIVVALVKHPAVRSGKYDLSSVTAIGSGAAPLGREIIAEVEALWPPGVMRVTQGWGLTEATCSVLGFHPLEQLEGSSVGELQPNCEAKVMSEDGTEELPRGQRGEIWIRGPTIMRGYWRNPEATKEAITEDGWLKTGDVGVCDERGRWYIVDRAKELIKVKGFQVAPAELEALLLEHPAVADAGVVGVTINEGELPRAYVVLQAGAKATSEEIAEFVRKNVSRNKWLAGGVVFTDVIPKNPSGKILRKILRERARKEVGDKEEKTSKL
ncbi:hypothetical protein FGG08_005878 [Glutinoglossum americanum]|uniref:4-coumarate--CoA ligase n=1 Tax=Glutinoglossum americanum TaxID=1670608 RepID=A0A9P8I4N7_9PEZI|nr:hypothetical protein FGG08_005878 [Glutinoglossum americanum]